MEKVNFIVQDFNWSSWHSQDDFIGSDGYSGFVFKVVEGKGLFPIIFDNVNQFMFQPQSSSSISTDPLNRIENPIG